MALILLPIATLLSYIGSDMRHKKEQRDRALALLKKLDTKFCLALSLSADWGLVTKAFLRLFDVNDHDIAKSSAEVATLIETLRALFLDGRVWHRPQMPAVGGVRMPAIGGHSEHTGPPEFITLSMEKQLRHKYVFHCGGLPVLLWGPATRQDLGELAERSHNVASATIKRLGAEYPDGDVRSSLSRLHP